MTDTFPAYYYRPTTEEALPAGCILESDVDGVQTLLVPESDGKTPKGCFDSPSFNDEAVDERGVLMAELDALGVEYNKQLGVKKLQALLDEHKAKEAE